jgi:hypothetical protein
MKRPRGRMRRVLRYGVSHCESRSAQFFIDLPLLAIRIAMSFGAQRLDGPISRILHPTPIVTARHYESASWNLSKLIPTRRDTHAHHAAVPRIWLIRREQHRRVACMSRGVPLSVGQAW